MANKPIAYKSGGFLAQKSGAGLLLYRSIPDDAPPDDLDRPLFRPIIREFLAQGTSLRPRVRREVL